MTIPSWARVGAKVVCVNAARLYPPQRTDEATPAEGQTYTIREVVDYCYAIGLRLVEIVNRPHDYADGCLECAFVIDAFRPLTTRTQEQDLELFLPLLVPKRERERA